MKVTKVDFNKYESDNLVGFANILLDDALVIKGVRLINGNNGYFVSFPSRQDKEGKWHNIVHPINSDLRQEITRKVLEEAGLENEKEAQEWF